jgi:PAS domain-containing protein
MEIMFADGQSGQRLMKGLLEKGSSVNYETEYKTKPGLEIEVRLSASVMRTREGKVAGIVTTATDITERKRIEEALRENEEKYRNLVERANDGIAIVQDTIVKYVNPSLAEVAGYTVLLMTK